MCIRDSLTSGQRFRIAKMLAYKDESGKLQPKAKWDKLGACLLYTSDAADERSSVDLGGRRIIKKKNEE